MLTPVHGFDHLDGDQLVERALQVPVVAVQDGDPIGQPLFHDPLGRIPELGVGDGGRGDPAAVVGRRMTGEATPSGADLHHVVVGAEVELSAQPVELDPLGGREIHVRLGEDRGRVHHRLVQHQGEELVGHVVVGLDVVPVVLLPGRPDPAEPVGGGPHGLTDPVLHGRDRAEAPVEHPGQGGEVVAVPLPVGVVATQSHRALEEGAPVDARVVDLERDLGGPGAEPAGAGAVDHHQGATAQVGGHEAEEPGGRRRARLRPDPSHGEFRHRQRSSVAAGAPSGDAAILSGCRWNGTPLRRSRSACR